MCTPAMWPRNGWRAGSRTRKFSSASWPPIPYDVAAYGRADRKSNATRWTRVATMNAPQTTLERLLRRQRILAWLLSTLTLTMTVGFFAMMTLAAPLLSRVAFGRSVTIANVAALAIILVLLASIALFGWQAGRIDQQLNDARNQR